MARTYPLAAAGSHAAPSPQTVPLRSLIALLTVSSALLAAYIANSPALDRFGDSPTYEFVSNSLPKSFISSSRLPGYPILIAIATWLPGGPDTGLICLQAALILAAVVATYLIARVALGHQWMALVVGLTIASDILIAGYVRVEMSETLAVILTLGVVMATLRFLVDFDPVYLWLTAALSLALDLTRPEWVLLMVFLVPYLLVIASRRGQLDSRIVKHGIASTAVVLIAIGAYCTGNLLVNGYFGLSSFSNVALLGKVKAYGMVSEAPPPYTSLIPTVESYNNVWELVTKPPFNDRNSVLAGDFARATILRDPLRFTQDVLGSLISSAGEHDGQFLRIQANGPFGRLLGAVLAIGQIRYRAFVILPALALAWMLAGLIVPGINRRAQIMGVLGLIVLYGWFTTAAGTFGEFGRLRMTVNPIGTTILFGTIFLTLTLAVRYRQRLIPALGLIALELAAIGFLPHITSIAVSEVVLLALAFLQTVAIVRWSQPLTAVKRLALAVQPAP
jgi:hypothetical protein